jgi:hypothetical protein
MRLDFNSVCQGHDNRACCSKISGKPLVSWASRSKDSQLEVIPQLVRGLSDAKDQVARVVMLLVVVGVRRPCVQEFVEEPTTGLPSLPVLRERKRPRVCTHPCRTPVRTRSEECRATTTYRSIIGKCGCKSTELLNRSGTDSKATYPI